MKALLFAVGLILGAPKSPDVEAPGGPWSRLPPPKEGEWLSVYREPGQTFSEYRNSQPVRPDGKRRRICILPCLTRAPADPALLERIRDYLAAFYGTPCDLLPPQALPAEAFHRERRQYRVERLAQTLLRALPEEALFLLAVTDRDLFIGDLTHVFGWASMRLRFGIVSTARVDVGRDRGVRLRRVLGLAAHECGHMLSMAHCVFYRCLMNGSQTVAESDARPLLLCPVCEAKLAWNLGLDSGERHGRLAGLLDGLGYPQEAALERLAAATPWKTKS